MNEEMKNYSVTDEMSGNEERERVGHEHAHQAAFWKWKEEVMLKILAHPAMRNDSTCPVCPNFDCPKWEKDFISGMSVEEAYQEAEEAFNHCGW